MDLNRAPCEKGSRRAQAARPFPSPRAIPYDEARDLQPETFVTADSIHCTPISIRAQGAREVRPETGVIGSGGGVGANVAAKSRGVGKETARRDAILLTVASTNPSYEAVRGTKEVDGSTTRFSPTWSSREHKQRCRPPVDSLDLLEFTGFGFKGRNVVSCPKL